MKVAAFLVLLLLPAAVWAADDGLVTKPSRHNVTQTIDRLEGLLRAKDVKVFARIDHAREAAAAGLEMRPAQLLVFGNPKAGTPAMRAAPKLAIDLPLKALAWEDSAGKVWLTYNDPQFLARRHGVPEDAMQGIAAAGGLIAQAAE